MISRLLSFKAHELWGFLLVFSAFNHIDIYFTFRQKSFPILVPLYIKVEWADAIKQMLPFSMWHANAVTEF